MSDAEEKEEGYGEGNVQVDLAGGGGVPLFKKFAMFDSGFVQACRTNLLRSLPAAIQTLPDIISAHGFIYRRTPAAEFGNMG